MSMLREFVVLAEPTPEVGLDEVIVELYDDKVVLSNGVTMIVLQRSAAVKMAAAVNKNFPLDALEAS
jgi:hypothetical protein